MWYLLQLEWKKFKHFRTFKVMAILYLVLLPLLLIVEKIFFREAGAPPQLINLDTIQRFPDLWAHLAYIGSWVAFFFLGFIGVLCVTMEYANKTLRQNIINGVTRNEFFTAKLLFILTVSLFATIYYALVGFSFGFINTNVLSWSKITTGTNQIFYYFLMCNGYMIFGFFLGVLIRRTGLALFLYLVYITFLEPILRWGVHRNIVENETMNYYPLNALEDLAPIPIPAMVKEMAENSDFNFILTQNQAAITTVVYSAIFIGLAYWRIKKTDL